MRIVCLTETILNPRRIVWKIWDSDSRSFIEGTDWIIHLAADRLAIVDRLQMALRHFNGKGCCGVTDEITEMLKTNGISLPNGWRSFPTKK